MCFSFFFCVANLENKSSEVWILYSETSNVSHIFKRLFIFNFTFKIKTIYFYILLKRGKVNLTDVYNASVNYDIPNTHKNNLHMILYKMDWLTLRYVTTMAASATNRDGVFNLCQHFEISYSRYANKHYITGVYIAINDIYR